MIFGKEYIIPKPLDPRLISTVAPAVAKAAIKSKVAKKKITDWKAYENELINRMGLDNKLINVITTKAKQNQAKLSNAKQSKAKQQNLAKQSHTGFG